MVQEAALEQTESGLVPKGEGWFVLNAKEARWLEHETFGSGTVFEGDPKFSELGINISVLAPGQPLCMYHREDAQEDFLVLFGDCLLLVEGEERPLKAWDLVHCPPWTDHVIVGAGDGPCGILAVGSRARDDIVYPVADVATRHGAGVEKETPDPKEAYAPFERPAEALYRGQLDGTS
jgi:uncharacterized cupin superfamily protein